MARQSQYLRPYLDTVAAGRLITPGTYLAQTLQGRAKDYMGHYYRALIRALDQEILAGRVGVITSIRGGDCYVRVADLPRVRGWRGAALVRGHDATDPLPGPDGGRGRVDAQLGGGDGMTPWLHGIGRPTTDPLGPGSGRTGASPVPSGGRAALMGWTACI